MANKDTYLPTGGGPHGISRAFVPEGTLAMINTHSLHRSADIFGGDADEFKPERWASLKTLNYWNYLPFGGGPRVCIGRETSLGQRLNSLANSNRTIRLDGSLVHAHSFTSDLSGHREPRVASVVGVHWNLSQQWQRR